MLDRLLYGVAWAILGLGIALVILIALPFLLLIAFVVVIVGAFFVFLL